MTSKKKDVKEWSILQGMLHTAVWIVVEDSKGNKTTVDIKAAPFH